GARLERPTAKSDRASFFHRVRGFQNLRAIFDAAWPGDDADAVATDFSRADGDHGALFAHLAAGHFVRGEHGHDLIDALDGFELGFVLEAVVADDGDDGELRADDDVFFESHFSHQVDDVIDLALG